MKKIKTRDVFDQFFVPKIHNRFRRDMPSVNKFKELLTEKGAILHLDHGATRTPSKAVHDLITRIGNLLV